jgi:hypothetical protein
MGGSDAVCNALTAACHISELVDESVVQRVQSDREH